MPENETTNTPENTEEIKKTPEQMIADEEKRLHDLEEVEKKRKQVEDMIKVQSQMIEDGKKTHAKGEIFGLVSKAMIDPETIKVYVKHLEMKFIEKLIKISKILPNDIELQFGYRKDDLDLIKKLEADPKPETVFELENVKAHLREVEATIIQLFDEIDGIKDRIDIDLEIIDELKK